MPDSGLDFTGLTHLADQQQAGDWRPLQQSDLVRPGYGWFFDQSLSATGWVLVHCAESHPFAVVDSGMFKCADHPDLTSKDLDVARATDIFAQVWVHTLDLPPHKILHVGYERPPQGKWVKGDGTSSLMAAVAVSNALTARGLGPIHVFDARSAKKVICGNANAEKKVAHEALKEFLPQIPGGEQITNEHLRDALLGALSFYTKGT